MQDYSISKCSRKCAVTGKPLEPGESYFSVLLPQGDEVVRQDIAASAWQGPHENALGWWRSKMPPATAVQLRPAPNGVLLDTLSELLEVPGKETLAYLLALLLMRRRVLSEDSEREPDPDSSAEPTHWTLVCPADGRQWLVPVVNPSPAEVAELQAELDKLLFTEE